MADETGDLGSPEAVDEASIGLESQEPEASQESAGPPPTYFDFDTHGDALVRMKFGDEVVELPARDAFLEGLRQADYTRKTQALAQERDQLTQASQLIAALEDNPQVVIAALQSAYAEEQGLGQESFDEPLDEDAVWRANVEQFIAQEQERQDVARLQGTLNSLHQTHGDFDDMEFVQYAARNGLFDLNEAYKAWSWDRLQEYEAARRQQDAALTEHKAGMPPVAGGHGVQAGAVVTGGAEPPKTFGDALKQTMAQNGISDIRDIISGR